MPATKVYPRTFEDESVPELDVRYACGCGAYRDPVGLAHWIACELHKNAKKMASILKRIVRLASDPDYHDEKLENLIGGEGRAILEAAGVIKDSKQRRKESMMCKACGNPNMPGGFCCRHCGHSVDCSFCGRCQHCPHCGNDRHDGPCAKDGS